MEKIKKPFQERSSSAPQCLRPGAPHRKKQRSRGPERDQKIYVSTVMVEMSMKHENIFKTLNLYAFDVTFPVNSQ